MIRVSQVYCHGATGYYAQKTQFIQTKRVSVCHQFSAALVILLYNISLPVVGMSLDCAVLNAFKWSGVAGT